VADAGFLGASTGLGPAMIRCTDIGTIGRRDVQALVTVCSARSAADEGGGPASLGLVAILVVVAEASFEVTVKDAVMEGPPGEARLVAMLDSLAGASKVLVVAVLGDAQGDQGPTALRSLLAAPQRSIDLRCAALLALAKREGAAASDVLAAHLTHAPAAVRDYAIISLAAVGDDRAWSQVHTILQRDLDRRSPTFQPRQLIPGLKQDRGSSKRRRQRTIPTPHGNRAPHGKRARGEARSPPASLAGTGPIHRIRFGRGGP
jgi:hypothetical protein